MSPKQVARLALEWYRANKADPIATIESTANTYRFTESQIAEAIGHLSIIAPDLVPSEQSQRWLHSTAN